MLLFKTKNKPHLTSPKQPTFLKDNFILCETILQNCVISSLKAIKVRPDPWFIAYCEDKRQYSDKGFLYEFAGPGIYCRGTPYTDEYSYQESFITNFADFFHEMNTDLFFDQLHKKRPHLFAGLSNNPDSTLGISFLNDVFYGYKGLRTATGDIKFWSIETLDFDVKAYFKFTNKVMHQTLRETDLKSRSSRAPASPTPEHIEAPFKSYMQTVYEDLKNSPSSATVVPHTLWLKP